MKLFPNKREFIEELPISDLPRFSTHRRLRLFLSKGINCCKCGIECSRLIWSEDAHKFKHIDLYDQTLSRMLTVGHIIPKSLGGGDCMRNTRPLCNVCNFAEGNNMDHILENRELFKRHCYGWVVRRKSGHEFQNKRKTATINSIFRSNNDGNIYFGFEGGFTYLANKCIFTTTRVNLTELPVPLYSLCWSVTT